MDGVGFEDLADGFGETSGTVASGFDFGAGFDSDFGLDLRVARKVLLSG